MHKTYRTLVLARVLAASSIGAAALVTLSAAAPRAASAAVTIVVQRGTGPQRTIYADGDHLRMDLPETAEQTGILIDAAARKMIVLNDREKTFTEITEDDLKRVQGQLTAARAQMAEQMKNMSPEQRKQMEQMMGPMAAAALKGSDKPSEWKFQPLGTKKTVNGFACQMYQVMLNGKAHEEDCIAAWGSLPVKKSDFSGLEKFSQRVNESLGFGARGPGIPLFHQYPGLPITRVVLEEGGGRGEEEQVKSIKAGAIPTGAFTVPAGYQKKQMPALGGGAAPGGPRPMRKPGAGPREKSPPAP